MPRHEVWILADQDEWIVETVHCIYCWQPRLLQVWLHAFWYVQCINHISEVNAKCLRELNLTYCLIYLDDIIIFLWMAEEHLHYLCVIFDQFREHNLKLKPLKSDFFINVISYLVHQVLRDRVCPSNSNLEAIAECALLQTYTEVCAFLSLVDHYRRFIKGFMCISQPLSEYFTGEGASMKLENMYQQQICPSNARNAVYAQITWSALMGEVCQCICYIEVALINGIARIGIHRWWWWWWCRLSLPLMLPQPNYI